MYISIHVFLYTYRKHVYAYILIFKKKKSKHVEYRMLKAFVHHSRGFIVRTQKRKSKEKEVMHRAGVQQEKAHERKERKHTLLFSF